MLMQCDTCNAEFDQIEEADNHELENAGHNVWSTKHSEV